MQSYLVLIASFAVLGINVYIAIDIFRRQTEILLKPFLSAEALTAVKRVISFTLLVGGISGGHILVMMKDATMSPLNDSGSFDLTNWLDSLFKAIFYAYEGLMWPLIIICSGLLITFAILKTKDVR